MGEAAKLVTVFCRAFSTLFSRSAMRSDSEFEASSKPARNDSIVPSL